MEPLLWQKWKALTRYIDRNYLSRHIPGLRVSSATAVSKIENEPLTDLKDYENIHFTAFDLRKSFPENCSPAERTLKSLDKSWLLDTLLKQSYHQGKIENYHSENKWTG